MKKQPIIQNHSIKSVIVIGAGLAGLTAAYRLQQTGFVFLSVALRPLS